MTALTQRAVQLAVVAWHNRHPLAAHIDSSQVHSVGWVALPFMRAAQGVEPTLAPSSLDVAPSAVQTSATPPARWKRWLAGRPGQSGRMRGKGPWAVFSEAFIEGLDNDRAAAFAREHGLTHLPSKSVPDSEWPQRRVELDGALAERAAGAWPMELWVASAAIDMNGQRCRVLVSPDGKAVIGRRHWNALRVQVLWGVVGATLLAAAAAYWQFGRSKAAEVAPPAPQASGVVAAAASATPASMTASAPLLAAPSPSSEPTPAASAVVAEASNPTAASAVPESGAAAPEPEPASASASLPASAAPMAAVPSASAPLIDIRPRLRPPSASPQTPTPTGSAPKPLRLPQREESPPARSAIPEIPSRGAATPESIRPTAPASGPLVALVSPGMAKKADAEAMLARMREHLSQTMGKADGLQGEVLESPEGWRAAVWPFASREEAQILNATMVARGWKTRAMNF